jgi:hypothetical protein
MADAHVDAMSIRLLPGLFQRGLVVSAAAMFVGAAFAADVKPPPQDQPAGSVPVDSKQVICKRVQPDDGGMLPGPKVCHTRAEWAEVEKQGDNPSPSERGKGHN